MMLERAVINAGPLVALGLGFLLRVGPMKRGHNPVQFKPYPRAGARYELGTQGDQ